MAGTPSHSLPNGDRIPGLGLGTFGSDRYSATEIGVAVRQALDVGYRHLDCASVYGNEREIGGELAALFSTQSIAREEVWVTSKVWNDRHHDVESACEQTLRDLRLDYLDGYLVHWPYPNHHAPGVDVGARDPHALPYAHDRYMATWAQMERLVRRGLVRHIGTSNMTIAKLGPLLRDAEIRPSMNQLELHPHFQQKELFAFLLQEGIVPVGYSPIGSPSRPERDRTPEDSVDIEDPVIVEIARHRGVHPAIVCVLWQIGIGSVPIPFSVKRQQFEAMIRAVEDIRLSAEDLDRISRIDRNCRLIKGQVFLWPGANGWEDLWDGVP